MAHSVDGGDLCFSVALVKRVEHVVKIEITAANADATRWAPLIIRSAAIVVGGSLGRPRLGSGRIGPQPSRPRIRRSPETTSPSSRILSCSRGVHDTIRFNMACAIGLKVVLAVCAVAGMVSPAVAALVGDMGGSLADTLNAFRLAHRRQ